VIEVSRHSPFLGSLRNAHTESSEQIGRNGSPLEPASPCDLDSQRNGKLPAESLRAVADPEEAVAVLGEKCLVLVRWGDFIRTPCGAGEYHDVAANAVAIEVQGDLGSVNDMPEPVRVDHAVDQDRVDILEQESDRVRLWGAVLADRSDPGDLLFAQPTPHPLADWALGSGSAPSATILNRLLAAVVNNPAKRKASNRRLSSPIGYPNRPRVAEGWDGTVLSFLRTRPLPR
jgi:hypothetical protein